MERPENLDLLRLTATELQRLLQQKKLSSVELVTQTLARIKKDDKAGLHLNKMISIAPRETLLEAAARLDAERAEGKLRGPLHGITVIIKDAINTHASLGLGTTVGSFALLTAKPRRSATTVEKLVEQGLIVVGKTNLNEFCNFKGNNSTNGWSPVGGQTQSAYVEGGLRLDDGPMGHSNPSGSSTGSAVGVSAGFSPLALGTETDGSLIQPAARAALFAMKPTIGSVEMDGIWPISPSFDAVGAMAKSTVDLALMTELLLKPEERRKLPDGGFLPALTITFEGLGVGFLDPIEWHFPPRAQHPVESVTKQIRQAFEDAIKTIDASGARTKFPVSIPKLEDLKIDGESAISIVIYRRFRDEVNRYLATFESAEVKTLEDIIKFNEENAKQELPEEYLDQSRLTRAVNDIPSEELYQRALKHCRKVAGDDGVGRALDEHNLDILAALTDCPIPGIAAASGYSIATVPMGTVDFNSRPFGLAIIAKPGREDNLFRFMSAFEVTFPARLVPPKLEVRNRTEDANL